MFIFGVCAILRQGIVWSHLFNNYPLKVLLIATFYLMLIYTLAIEVDILNTDTKTTEQMVSQSTSQFQNNYSFN